MNGQRHAIDQAVRHLDGLNGEGADAKTFSRPDLDQFGVIQQPVLFQFVFDVSQRELGGKDGHVQLGKQPGNGADMVQVPVRQDYAAHARTVVDEISEVRDHDIDAEQLGLWKHEPGVDHDNVVAPAYGHAVHPEFAKATERNDLKFS